MSEILILKTAALGDVLRTTSILPGLRKALPGVRITWLTAPAAVDLLRTHPLVEEVIALDVHDAEAVQRAGERLVSRRFDRVISLDDEEPLCALASRLTYDQLSGAYLTVEGRRAYTSDVAPWFDMGLLSVLGKEEADRLKLLNTKSHPEIYAAMLGIEMGKPELHLTREARAFAALFAAQHGLASRGKIIGLNTGAGGRWLSKQLPLERTIELATLLFEKLNGQCAFLVMGGESELERNRAILDGLRATGLASSAIDAGCHNPLLHFAALVETCDLIITSDSLALHMAIAQGVHTVAFFAPTSAAEIELYGLGEKVQSTSPDYCSYRPDADNSSITAEVLAQAALRVLAHRGETREKRR